MCLCNENISPNTAMVPSNYLLIVGTQSYWIYIGESANAVPRYHKLRTRVTHIWGNRRRQPNRSAMGGPQPGGTAFLITVSSVPGKYALLTKPLPTILNHDRSIMVCKKKLMLKCLGKTKHSGLWGAGSIFGSYLKLVVDRLFWGFFR